MGLFDRLRGDRQVDPAPVLTPQEAFVGVAVCAMYADDLVAGEEDEELVETLSALPLFGACAEHELRAMHGNALRLASRLGDAATLRACAAALTPEMRAEAFRVAVELVQADGEVGPEEDRFLDRIRDLLGVDPALASGLLAAARAR